MASSEYARTYASSLQSEISNLIVRMFSEYTGRGPTKARTVIAANIVTCVTHHVLTKAEQRLVAEGEGEMVDIVRHKFQLVMGDELIAGVQRLTGCNVVSFM